MVSGAEYLETLEKVNLFIFYNLIVYASFIFVGCLLGLIKQYIQMFLYDLV